MCHTAASVALQIHEIVKSLMEALQDDKRSLVVCAQVCKLWADEATAIIWEESVRYPIFRKILALKQVDSSRLKWYARKIRVLDLSPCINRLALAHESFRDTEFPRLAILSIPFGFGNSNTAITQYFQSRLRRVSLPCASLSDSVLRDLAVTSPFLYLE